jgi:AraC-like DNA-binding protein
VKDGNTAGRANLSSCAKRSGGFENLPVVQRKGQHLKSTIPVIRAGGIIPLLKWLVDRKHPVEDLLRTVGLGYVWVEDALALVPIRALEKVVLVAATLEGPDVGCRIIRDQSLAEIGVLGSTIKDAKTAREALTAVSMAMPYHCSHELFSLNRGEDVTILRDYWTLALDPIALQVIQQFVAGVVHAVLRQSVSKDPKIHRIAMVPHPQLGLSHLAGWLPVEITASSQPVLEISVSNAVLDAPLRPIAGDGTMDVSQLQLQRLRDGTIAGPAQQLICGMLGQGAPTIEQFSGLADMSVRTLQRKLAQEGTTFSDLIEDARRAVAMAALARTEMRITDVSALAGYSNQSSLTRAVRRWTGQAPLAMRDVAKTDDIV